MHGALALSVLVAITSSALAPRTSPRQIVEEAQRRTEAKSERYEGLLRVIDAKGKVADKRWIFTRLGAHGNSKAVLRFVEPAEVKGVTLLIVNHPDRASDQWMWTPALQRERRIALAGSDPPGSSGRTSASKTSRSATSISTSTALLGEEAIDGAACWRIESAPSQKKISQVLAVRSVDPQRQLRVGAGRELHQRTTWSGG